MIDPFNNPARFLTEVREREARGDTDNAPVDCEVTSHTATMDTGTLRRTLGGYRYAHPYLRPAPAVPRRRRPTWAERIANPFWVLTALLFNYDLPEYAYGPRQEMP